VALEGLVRPELGIVVRGVMSRDELFQALSGKAASAIAPDEASPSQADILDALEARELKGTTATRDAVAFPHAILGGETQLIVIPAVVTGGVLFSPGGVPATLIFFTAGSRRDASQHIRVLARLSRCVLQLPARERLLNASDPRTLVERLLAEDRTHG